MNNPIAWENDHTIVWENEKQKLIRYKKPSARELSLYVFSTKKTYFGDTVGECYEKLRASM